MAKKRTSRVKKKFQDLEHQTREKKKQEIIQSLRQMTSSVDDARDSNDVERSLRTRGKARAYSKKDSMFVQAGASRPGNNNTSANECYRCKHFLNIPSNLSQPPCPRTAGLIGQCEADISFVQAIVWLKSSIVCVSQLSVEQLQRVFHRQWDTQDNHPEKKSSDNDQRAKRLKRPAKKPSVPETIDTQDIFAMLTPRNTCNPPRSPASQGLLGVGSSVNSGEMQIDLFSLVSTIDTNEPSTHVFSTRDKCTSWIMGNSTESKSEETLPESDATSMMDEELLLNSSWDMSYNETFDDLAEYQIIKADETAKCSTQLMSENHTKSAKKEQAAESSKADTGNESHVPQLASGDNFVFLAPKMPLFAPIVDQKQKQKPISSTMSQSDETNFLQLNFDFDESFITPIINRSKPSSLVSDCSLRDFAPISENTSLVSIDAELWEPQSFNNFQTDQSAAFDNNRSEFETKFDDLGKLDMQTNSNAAAKNSMYDSAYSTLHIELHDYHIDETAKPATDDHRVSYGNIPHHYDLRSYHKKTIMPTETATLTGSPITPCEKQSSANKRKRGRPRKEKMISAKWLNFTLELQDLEHVILESVKVILSTLSKETMAEEYATHSCWKDTLMEKAVNAVLNVSDVLRLEKKPDICRKEIVTAVIETLDEIATCVKLNKTFVCDVRIYRVQIILELCNSVSVSIPIIDHLIAKLKSFLSALSRRTKTRLLPYATVNQLHLVFYALNIALRKYRIIMPNARRSYAAETAIPHVADLWKTRYIDEELEYARLNVNDAEERWRGALGDCASAFTPHFVQFAEKSLSLAHMLTSQ